jgi:hypothetical protein
MTNIAGSEAAYRQKREEMMQQNRWAELLYD